MKFFRLIGGLLGVLLLVVFVVVLPATVWAFNLQQALFDRDISTRIVQDESLYNETTVELITTVIDRNLDEEPGSSGWFAIQFLQNLDDEQRLNVVTSLAPRAWFNEQLEYNLDETFTWVDGPTVRPDLYFELAPLAQGFGSEAARGTIPGVLAAWPACTEAQETTVSVILDGSAPASASLPACEPQDEELNTALMERLDTAFAQVSEELPQTVPTEEERERTLSESERVWYLNNKAYVRVLERVSFLVFLVPLVFLLLIQIATVRSFKGLFGWFGWSLLLGGVLALALPLAVFFLPAAQIVYTSRQLSVDQLQAAFVLLGVLGEITQPILIQATAITLVGTIFVIVGSSMRKPES